jgi:hypothetical protein
MPFTFTVYVVEPCSVVRSWKWQPALRVPEKHPMFAPSV